MAVFIVGSGSTALAIAQRLGCTHIGLIADI
jgi:hypothetical protein